MKKLFLVTLIFLAGCATAQKLNNVSIGMTKQEVIAVMGTPSSTSAKGEVVYLNYLLTEINGLDQSQYYHFVLIKNGKVESYGKLGDFDSTKDNKTVIDLNVNK